MIKRVRSLTEKEVVGMRKQKMKMNSASEKPTHEKLMSSEACLALGF